MCLRMDRARAIGRVCSMFSCTSTLVEPRTRRGDVTAYARTWSRHMTKAQLPAQSVHITAAGYR